MNDSTLPLDEIKDVHPIFRANPFFIEDGFKLVRGEKYFSNEELKHIDLLFIDKNKILSFVEVKWSDVSESQMINYRRLVDNNHPNSRLMWAVPIDLMKKASIASKYNIELKTFDRSIIYAINKLQNRATRDIQEISALLSAPFTVAMHGEKISFENVITACYFEGRATTERGTKKLGLKQQSVGRQLDLIRNLLNGHIPDLHKEKVLLLLRDILKAPYLYKPGKFWRIVNGGFIELIKERQERDVEKLTIKIWEIVNKYYTDCVEEIKRLYSKDNKKCDLLLIILAALAEGTKKPVFSIDEAISFFIDEFEIRTSQAIPKIRHSVLNQWVENIASIKNYENDKAKRLLEIACLKRMLIPKMGTVDMWILTPTKQEDVYVAQRQPCQMLSYNSDSRLHIEISKYQKEESHGSL